MGTFSKAFTRLFPVPKFLEMPTVGFDISDHAIRFVELGHNSRGIILKRYKEIPLTAGIIKNGDIVNPAGFSKILGELKEKYNIGYVRVSLPEEKAYLFRTEIPISESENIRNAIEFKLDEHVPISSKEAIFDYVVIPNQTANHNHLDVSVSVLPRDFTASYLEAFHLAEIQPISFEVEARATAKAVIKNGDKRTFLIVDFGEDKTVLSIAKDNVVYFTSTIVINGSQITSAIQKFYNVSTEEAQKLKYDKGLTGHKEDDEIFGLVINNLAALKDEINKIIIYWQSHSEEHVESQASIDEIIFCGKNSAMPGFAKYMSSSLKIPVELGNVWCNMFSFDKKIPEVRFVDSLNLAPAIGLVLPECLNHA